MKENKTPARGISTKAGATNPKEDQRTYERNGPTKGTDQRTYERNGPTKGDA